LSNTKLSSELAMTDPRIFTQQLEQGTVGLVEVHVGHLGQWLPHFNPYSSS
jgi:hypothetical protein